MKDTTWNRDILKSFKPCNTIKTGCLVSLWVWPDLVMGRQWEQNFQKKSWKAKKISQQLRPPSFLFFKLVSSTLWPFCCFYLMFGWPKWTWNCTRWLAKTIQHVPVAKQHFDKWACAVQWTCPLSRLSHKFCGLICVALASLNKSCHKNWTSLSFLLILVLYNKKQT